MKSKYLKPAVQVQVFTPQECLCACKVANPNHSEAAQCGYPLDDLGITVFAQSWSDCQITGNFEGYCYQPGQSNLFSS